MWHRIKNYFRGLLGRPQPMRCQFSDEEAKVIFGHKWRAIQDARRGG